jgi:hypothetical protein
MSNALGVLAREAEAHGWTEHAHPENQGLGTVEYTKGDDHAVLVWNIAEQYAQSVALNEEPQHGSGALISLRRFLEGKDPDDGIAVIEAEGLRAWYAGT